jgi:5'-nucleotidase
LAGENEEVRTRETTLGNLLADLARRHAGTEIALVNAGMVRSSIPAGPVTLKRVMEVLPFDSTVTTFSITGAQLQAALEHSVSRLPQSSGRFLQVSGLTMTFDPAAASGNRIRTIRVNDAPLDLSRRYSVASVAFIAEGGDGYSMFLHATDKRDHQVPIRDLLISALKSGSLTAKEEGRIVRQ